MSRMHCDTFLVVLYLPSPQGQIGSMQVTRSRAAFFVYYS